MTQLSLILFIAELIGVVAFAVAGALKAIECDMDVFGIMVLAVITALGGGIIRDLMINRFPVSLSTPVYFYAAIAGGIVTLLTIRVVHRYLLWLKIFDAMGLAVFSVLGAQVGLARHFHLIAVVLLGLLTGIGGGILRDVLANEVPLVCRQEIYALASLLGILVLWALPLASMPPTGALILAIILIFVIRLAAIHWNWHLPRIRHHR